MDDNGRKMKQVEEMTYEEELQYLATLPSEKLAEMVMIRNFALETLRENIANLKEKNHNLKMQLKALERAHVMLKVAYKGQQKVIDAARRGPF